MYHKRVIIRRQTQRHLREDHRSVVAAELEREALQGACADLTDLLARRDAAREGDLRKRVVRRHHCAQLVAAGEDRDDPLPGRFAEETPRRRRGSHAQHIQKYVKTLHDSFGA